MFRVANETFQVILSNPTNVSISDNQGIVTISDTLKSAVNTTLPAKIENLQCKDSGRGLDKSGEMRRVSV